MDELVFASAEELADAIRTKRVSSVEVLTAHLQRIEDVNPKLNAIVQLRSQEAIDEARQADAALARGEDTGPGRGGAVGRAGGSELTAGLTDHRAPSWASGLVAQERDSHWNRRLLISWRMLDRRRP